MIFQTLPTGAQGNLPVIFPLLFIAPAVAIFIYSGTRLEKYKYIDEGLFSISETTKAILNQRREELASNNKIGITIGVCLCILSPIAIFIGSGFGSGGSTYGVCVLLLIISVAVFMFIHFGSSDEAYKKLMKLGEFSPVEIKKGKVIGAVASVVWPLVTCIFLFWGFLFNGWRICWIVFPITGILFGSFCAIYNAIKG